MAYVDGFVAAVKTANKTQYIEYAKTMGLIFKEYGVLSIMETWGDDIPDGELTSFPMAVQCKADESVVFSWMIWASKGDREKAWQAMMDDPRMNHEDNAMPFDGKRLIYGGFETILEM